MYVCNAVFYGTSRNNIDKLQRVQNTLARVVKQRSKHDHITPLLSELHWSPIEARIRHKIAVLTLKAVSTSKPSYLAELISTYTPARELRSSSRRPNQLFVPNVRTAFGSRAFRHAAPAVWNGLPSAITDTALSLETFKSRLKTYLYNQSFRCWSCYRSASAIRRLVTTTYDALQTVYYYYYYFFLIPSVPWIPRVKKSLY